MRQLLKFLVAAVALILPAFACRADITFSTLGAEDIYNGTSSLSGLAPAGSLVLLVAHESLTGNFGPLYEGNISVGASINPSGQDIVLAQLTLSATAGLLNTSVTLSLSGNWATGDALAIYWIPSINALDTPNVGATVSYGMYTDASGVGGSEPWVTPVDGSTTDTLYFSTTGVTFTMNAPSGTGFADFTTVPAVPEPAAGALAVGALSLGLVIRRRR
jgi:hypothetical protein